MNQPGADSSTATVAGLQLGKTKEMTAQCLTRSVLNKQNHLHRQGARRSGSCVGKAEQDHRIKKMISHNENKCTLR